MSLFNNGRLIRRLLRVPCANALWLACSSIELASVGYLHQALVPLADTTKPPRMPSIAGFLGARWSRGLGRSTRTEIGLHLSGTCLGKQGSTGFSRCSDVAVCPLT